MQKALQHRSLDDEGIFISQNQQAVLANYSPTHFPRTLVSKLEFSPALALVGENFGIKVLYQNFQYY
jgi:hypothetical protein